MFIVINTTAAVIVIGVLISMFVLIMMSILVSNRTYKTTQGMISDRDILLMILNEPDNFITVDKLARISPLSKSEARSRLRSLKYAGVLTALSNNKLKQYYKLREEIQSTSTIQLDDTPYLSTEDILRIFKHYDFNVSLAKICFATNLPIKEIKREMTYYVKEGVVEMVYEMIGHVKEISYLLKEPYRSTPDLFLEKMDLPQRYKEKVYRYGRTDDTV